MYRLFFTPTWFSGVDIIFDTIGLLITFLLAAYSWRIYRINKENIFAYLSFAFLLISIGLAASAFTQGVLGFKPLRDIAADVLAPVTGPRLSLSHLYYRAAFFIQMASMLGAWLLIFFVSQKPRARLRKFYEITQIGLFIYLMFLISVVSNFKYVVFYLTSSVLLALIVLNYYKKYLNTQNKKTLLVMFSFLFILLGNLFLVFVFTSANWYVVGEALVLAGFLLLLYIYHSIVNKR